MSEEQNPTILIVDDNAETRVLMRITMGRSGWDVLEASDGIEAIELAFKYIPDLVLTDYNMPDLTGVDVCRELKSHPETQHIPLIVFTGAYIAGSFPNDIKNAAFEAGAAEFLVKPILPVDLRARVNKVYEDSKAR